MPDPRNSMKAFKRQGLNKLLSCMEEIIKTITILDYDPEYAEMYLNVVTQLRELRAQDTSYSLVQYWEMVKDNDDMPDLGTRYKYLIEQLDIYLDLFELHNKWSITII